jgi:hypothetical protein
MSFEQYFLSFFLLNSAQPAVLLHFQQESVLNACEDAGAALRKP